MSRFNVNLAYTNYKRSSSRVFARSFARLSQEIACVRFTCVVYLPPLPFVHVSRAVSLAEACDRPTKHLKTSTNIASSLLSSRSHLCRLLLPRFAWTLPRALRARIVVVERRRFIFVISTFVDRVYVRRTPATRTRDAHINAPFVAFCYLSSVRFLARCGVPFNWERGSFNVKQRR